MWDLVEAQSLSARLALQALRSGVVTLYMRLRTHSIKGRWLPTATLTWQRFKAGLTKQLEREEHRPTGL